MNIRPSRPLLAALAVLFALSLLLYTGLWVVAVENGPQVELGFDNDYRPADHSEYVRAIYKDSPAQHSGLRVGDSVVAVDNIPITDGLFMNRAWMQHKPGDHIHLTVRRPGTAQNFVIESVFRRRLASRDFWGRQLNVWFPWPFLIVGLAVLFLRLEDLTAWLLALEFAGVIVSRQLPQIVPHPVWWPVAMAYQAILLSMVGPFFYWFYTRFPARGPIDRRWPQLKWALAGFGVCFAWGGIPTGGIRLPQPLTARIGENASVDAGTAFVVFCLALGLVSFAATFFASRDRQARRRTRVVFWATLVSLGPNVLRLLIETFTNYRPPAWVEAVLVTMLMLSPLALAYAVLVHQVLEIPVLLKRSARYLMVQRGFTVLLSLFSIGLTLLFALSFPRLDQASGITLGAVFGTGLLWSGTQFHKRMSDRIDRAFFRNSYDARMILEDLAEQTRTATSLPELARLLEVQLAQALKPRFVFVKLQPGAIPTDAEPECVVPILDRSGGQLGALVLGPRLSEETYSGEDRRMLASVASQTASALENIRLAGEIAERIEAERRTAREMEIARDVQSRLLPRAPPPLRTLECAARCIQARAVGGDYYDFIDLGSDRVGLVLADVSGKGVHAALLVANLQANLRSQCSMISADPVGLLRQVNQILFRSTAPQHFATLFFGVYDDSSRGLVYVNCGHNPPLWLRRDGSVARLEATATVIGAFANWQGTACRAQLNAGDLLAVYSDGITEAPRGEEEFGECRLIEELRAHAGESVNVILSGILERVQEFSSGAQTDDLTLLIARAC